MPPSRRHSPAPLALALTLALPLSLAACGGSSSSGPSNDAGSSSGGHDGGGTLADGASSGGPDGSTLADGATLEDAGGAWGPCSLSSIGHPGAVPFPLTIVQPPGAKTACGSASSPTLFQTPAEYETFEASLDAGASGDDAGAPYANLIDWTTYSLLILDTTSHDTLTAGAEGVNGDQIVITRGELCEGAAPICTETAYRVPFAASVTVVGCPLPSAPCQAP